MILLMTVPMPIAMTPAASEYFSSHFKDIILLTASAAVASLVISLVNAQSLDKVATELASTAVKRVTQRRNVLILVSSRTLVVSAMRKVIRPQSVLKSPPTSARIAVKKVCIWFTQIYMILISLRP